MSLPKRIEITEVGPRDGWQNHKAMIIPTEVKAKYVKKMIDAGADKIEVTSFVNPKAVPQMQMPRTWLPGTALCKRKGMSNHRSFFK